MKIIDTHCDLLYKMFLNRSVSFTEETEGVDVSYSRLKQSGIALQWFAIFLPPNPAYHSIEQVLTCIDLFRSRIAAHPEISLILSREDWSKALAEGKMGVMLTLEGVEGLTGNMAWLRIAYHLGVRSIGITWNPANWAADGVGEPRNGGFTTQGKKMVRECDRLDILLDVSHLSEKAFWELNDLSSRPFIATHSNSYRICPHPRNLRDDQIQLLIRKHGRIGLTFVPQFVSDSGPAISDLLKHLDHVCSLGGENIVGFGSDFDGIESKIPRLEHPGHYGNLVEELYKHYNSGQVQRFLFGNWNSFLLAQLPEH